MDQPTRSGPDLRVMLCGLVVGLLFAVISGVISGVADLSSAEAIKAGTSASVWTVFAPVPALFGFLIGALLGTAVGALWCRPGLRGVIGFSLVTAVGGLAGLTAAGLFGAETRVVISGNSVEADYGAPPAVLAIGAVLGLVLGGLVAWRLAPPAKAGDPNAGLPA